MQDKYITIGEQDIHFRSTGSTPRIYRLTFGKDLFADMQKLQIADGEVPVESMEIFENITYVMAKQGAQKDGTIKDFPKSVDEWLDNFDMLDFYTCLPEILALWSDNVQTKSVAKKK